MSLKAFQNTWLELLYQPEFRSAWQRGESIPRQLTSQEQAGLQALAADQLHDFISNSQQHLQDVLQELIPNRLQRLLDPPIFRDCLQEWIASEALPPLFPRSSFIAAWGRFLQQYLQAQELLIPHLQDMLLYELSLGQLRFFSLPGPENLQPGPQLASWSKVLSLGEQFPLVLNQLKQEQQPIGLAEYPKRPFLLYQNFGGTHLERLPQMLAECLLLCDGQLSWQDILEQVQTQHPAQELPYQELSHWYQQYLQQGILVSLRPA